MSARKPRLMESDIAPPCTCTVVGPDYDDTTFDPACPYHGEHGSMVATIHPTLFRESVR